MPESLIDLAGLQVGAEEFLAAVLKTAEQPIWVVDPDGVIRFANPAAIAALGYDDARELLGRHSHETIHHSYPDGSHYPAALCPMLLPRTTGETVARELDWFFRRDGSMIPVSYVSAPLEMPEGRGAVVAFTDIEDRMRAERALHERDDALMAQQASLRRVATLVAGGAASAEVFAAIAHEVAHMLGLSLVELWRYERDATATVLGSWSDRPHPLQPGVRWPLDGPTVARRVKETGGPVRVDDFAGLPGRAARAARESGITSGAGAPILVDGEVWGVMATHGIGGEPLPDHIEDRLAEFTALIAAAFSNTASQDALARLADEQAALRRVATLVARDVPPRELFAAVTREAGRLLETDLAGMIRYEPGDMVTAVASWAAEGERDELERDRQWPLDGESLAPTIKRTGRPARIDDWAGVPGTIAAYVRDELGLSSSAGSPIVVDGHVWGALVVHTRRPHPLPWDTESRLGNFTDLVATGIMNVHARAEVRRLADEQAALRRVATRVARESSSADVFAAVAEEVGKLLDVDETRMIRYEHDGTATVVAEWNARGGGARTGSPHTLGGANVTTEVLRTGRPARVDDAAESTGAIGDVVRDLGLRSVVGTPIVVAGGVWGVMVAASRRAEPLPPDTEARIGEFTELVATAISNMQARSDLAASRARIVAATDEERRRVVRDLHDGAQQRLVHTVITLKQASRALKEDPEGGPALVTEALGHAEDATAELRELAHGILPSVLSRGGLRAGVLALASRMTVPIDIDVDVGRLPRVVAATAYFVVAEALTNVVKHSHAERAAVEAHVDGGTLRVRVRDHGVGGARLDGSGLLGLADRLAALDGRFRVEGPPGGGTLVAADIPVPDAPR